MSDSLIKCACGCGNELSKYDKYGTGRKYIRGHSFKNKHFSEEHKRKIKEANKETKNSKEWKETIGKKSAEKQKKTKSSAEWKDTTGKKAAKKRSESLKGKHTSIETEFKKGMKIPEEWKKKWDRKGDKNSRFKYDKSNPPLCKCGCGKPTAFNYGLKRFCDYITGHNSRGETNSAFNNWSSREPYGKEFSPELKELIRKRDKYRCQECFRHQDELYRKNKNGKIVKYKLDIHHIDFNKNNNDANNLISLCRSCHTQTNFNRESWTDYFQNKLLGGN